MHVRLAWPIPPPFQVSLKDRIAHEDCAFLTRPIPRSPPLPTAGPLPLDHRRFRPRTGAPRTRLSKTPPAANLLLKEAGVEKGSGVPNRTKVGRVTRAQLKKIAEINKQTWAYGKRLGAGALSSD